VRLSKLRRAAALSLLATVGTAVSAATLYSNDFEANANGFSFAGSLKPSAGYAAFGFGSQLWHDDNGVGVASMLTVNLPSAATSVVMSFSLAVIDSWDDGSFCCGPDKFYVSVDGVTVFSQVFDNYLNAGPSVAPGLVSLAYGSNLGFNPSYNDAAYTVTLNLGGLSAGVHRIQFTPSGAPGWQGGTDESWAIDNLVITGDIAAVPEPQSYALMLGGLAAMVLRRRKS
jgi:hypothetical protein